MPEPAQTPEIPRSRRRSPRARPVPRLKDGDLVALAAPAGAVTHDVFRRAAGELASFGYRVTHRPDIFENNEGLAGSDQRRADELMEHFTNPRVKGIFCAAAGYGSLRVLPHLDFDVIRQHPKALVGYSDITALLLAVLKRARIAVFHGPTVGNSGGRELSDLDWLSLQSALQWTNRRRRFRFRALRAISKGVAEAPLVGGNLDLLISLLGTPWEYPLKGRILFLEEVDASHDQVDQQLVQLRLSGRLAGVAGIVFGRFIWEEPTSPDQAIAVFRGALGTIDVPMLYGFPAGHEGDNVTLPLGPRYRLDANRRMLIQLEPGVRR